MVQKEPDDSVLVRAQQQLEEKRNELLQRIERLRQSGREPLSADFKEQAVELENYEVMDGLMAEATVELSKVSAALERIGSQTYGVCLDCGEAIAVPRLKARPYAQRCMPCQERSETQGATSSG